MNLTNIESMNTVSILKPNVTSIGYSLFLAINAAGVWGGVFPFLPMEFQTPEIVFWFFLSQSLVFSLSYFASALGVYFFPAPTRRFVVMLASAPYFLGWCCLIGAIYLNELALPLVICGGALLGLGAAGFFMLWQRLFSSLDADRGNRDLILGTAYASVLYFSLYLIPQAVTVYLIPFVFLPLFGLTIVLKSREIDRNQPMFEDVPREHPHVYRRVLHDYWRSALCVGALGFCTGIMRSLAIGEAHMGTLVNVLSMAGSLVAAIVLLGLWQFKNLRLNVVGAYRFVFPFVITSFLLLPFLPAGYARWLAAILYAVYSVAIMLMMIQCAQASRDRGINPVFIYGFFAGIVYVLHDVGFISGSFAEQIRIIDIDPLAIVALGAVYLLGLMHFIGQGGFGKVLGRNDTAENIELVALRPISRSGKAQRGTTAAPNTDRIGSLPQSPQTGHNGNKQQRISHANHPSAYPSREDTVQSTDQTIAASHGTDQGRTNLPSAMSHERQADEPFYHDRISKQAALVRQYYRLSAREAEVMELIARGNTVARIAEELIVSENTIRTHSKRIYAKLDIHKKQELLDVIESFNPSELDR